MVSPVSRNFVPHSFRAVLMETNCGLSKAEHAGASKDIFLASSVVNILFSNVTSISWARHVTVTPGSTVMFKKSKIRNLGPNEYKFKRIDIACALYSLASWRKYLCFRPLPCFFVYKKGKGQPRSWMPFYIPNFR